MNTTTNFGLKTYQSSDLFNPLTVENVNMEIIDTDMKAIDDKTIGRATELVSQGVHAITLLDTDAKVFKFVATANYTAGETFTVNGIQANAYTPSGSALTTNAYVTGSIVIGSLNADNTAITFYLSGSATADNALRLGGELPAYYATQTDLSDAETDITNLKNLTGNTSIVGIGDGTMTGGISSLNEAVFDALNAGAVDFIAKPGGTQGEHILEWVREELIEKVKIAALAKGKLPKPTVAKKVASTGREYKNKVLAIGASTGGTEAIYDVVKNFHKDIPGTVVVQHMPPGFTKMYAQRLEKQCEVSVKEAENGDLLEPGKVLIAPGNRQMRLTKTGGVYRVEVKEGEKVSGHCPSVDVLFQSVAKTAASDAVGVLLTGMGSDGAKGLLAMRKAGAKTIGQDEKTSVVYGMPRVAYEIGAVTYQIALENIAAKVYNIFNTMP